MNDKSKEIETIYNAALNRPSESERKAYLDAACGDDSSLRARVEELLRANSEAGDFLEVHAIEPGVTLDKPPSFEGPGTKIGHYELLELIGEGGMGLVYLAQQKEPVRRKVVLKIVKPGMDSKQVIARFEAERQVLAILDHPNIAHVFDAGTTDTGRPYFVMEYVKGMSITRYCDEKKLSIEQRLRLFEQVCEGIHHAHQKGIIHRDIKPSNVLVSVHGDKAVPKIIDFGIAKAVTSPLTDKTFVTFQGQLLGTPEYMSPEQVDLATQDIDTRSDIYSLGVVLYELLTGVLPFEEESFGRRGFAEIQRTIREVEPASPSMRLTNLGEQAKTIAATRGTQVVPLARRLHRELEWIPLKAMRKDRCRRYRSASEMADDIHNYLTGRPLIAGPETAIYRVKKFVNKHAGSVATATVVAIAIILGLVISTAMYFRAEDARQKESVARAQAEQATAKESAARVEAEQAKNAEQEQRKIAEERTEKLRRSLYVSSIQLADAKYREGNIGNVRKLLESCPEELRGWEWDRINYVLDQSLLTFIVDESWVWSVSLSPDGKSLVTGGSENALKVWDINTGKVITTLSGAHSSQIYCAEFSPDGKYIVSGDSSGEIKVWAATDVNEPITSIRHGNSLIRSVTFSPDGTRLLSVSSISEEIKVWDIVTGTEIKSFSGNPYLSCATFSPDGTKIISGDMDGVIKILDANSGIELMKLIGHDDYVTSVSFNSDGTLLASGSEDSTIKLWNVVTGSAMMTLRGHEGATRSVAFSPDS